MKYEDELRELHEAGHWIIPCKNKAPMVKWKMLQDDGRRPTWEDIGDWDDCFSPPMWGSITGQVSGWWGLDFDGDIGESTREALGLEPHTITPSGGSHAWIRYPGFRVKTLSAKTDPGWAELYPSVDVRGDGGQLIVIGGDDDRGFYRRVRTIDPYPIDVLPDSMLAFVKGGDGPPRPRAKTALVPVTSMSIVPRRPDDEARITELVTLAHQAIHLALDIGRNNAGFELARRARDRCFTMDEAACALLAFADAVGDHNTKGEFEPYTPAHAEATLRSAYSWAPDGSVGTGMPVIDIGGLYTEIADEILERVSEVNNPPTLFQRGGVPVRVVVAPDRPPQIESHDRASLRGHLMRRFDFVRASKEGDISRSEVPEKAVTDILALPDLASLPLLSGLLSAPTLRPDGSVLSADGYDPQTRLLLTTRTLDVPPIRDHPDDAEVERSLHLIDDLIGDFPFADRASRANAVATLITPILRPAIPGVTPLIAIDAPQPRSGKTLIAQLVGLISTGYPTPVGVLPRDDQELEKRLTSFLLAGDPVVAFDNVDHRIESGDLAAAITGATWTGRELGRSRRLVLENRTMWLVTGNNLTLGGDMAPRSVLIRLNAQLDRPQDRDFVHDDLLTWAEEHRSLLVWAALTIGRAGWRNGPPKPRTPIRMAGFQPWVTICAGILEAVGIEGFLENRGQLERVVDTQHEDWCTFLGRWRDLMGDEAITVADLRRRLDAGEFGDELPAEITDAIGAVNSTQQGRRLSAALMGRRDRRHGSLYLQISLLDKHTKTMRFVVQDGNTP